MKKCLVHIEESVLLQVVCTGPLTCVCSTLQIAQKKLQFFLWCGKVGGCLGLHGVSEGGGVI